MKLFPPGTSPDSRVAAIGALFVARRSALKAIRNQILAGTGLTPEIAELLFELLAATKDPAFPSGYVSCQDLLAAVDYSAGLLSRRLHWLAQKRWVEIKRSGSDLEKGIHGNSRKVRITDAGKIKVTPVWKKYAGQAEEWLANIPAVDLAAYLRVNEIITNGGTPGVASKIHPTARSLSPRPAPKPISIPPPPPPAPTPPRHLLQAEPDFLD